MDCMPSTAASFRLIARRNDSISPAARRGVLLLLVVVSLGIAVGWSLRGAWVILPFALLEMVVLLVAFKIVASHAGDFEAISIEGDKVLLERVERGRSSRHEFNRHWAQLIVRRTGPAGACVLAMRSHGREVGFGQFLTDGQRLAVADEIRRRLNNY